VVEAYCSWEEYQKFFPVMIQWLGFRKVAIEVTHDPRKLGASSYSLTKLLKLGLDVIFSFSDRPLWITALAGLGVAAAAFVAAIVFTVLAMLGHVAVQGWASLIISVWLLSGVILASIGLTGIYVGRVLRESKGRPAFVIAEVLGVGLPAARKTSTVQRGPQTRRIHRGVEQREDTPERSTR
jgi:dolichol-phosphate mannosyltransferase